MLHVFLCCLIFDVCMPSQVLVANDRPGDLTTAEVPESDDILRCVADTGCMALFVAGQVVP